MTFLVVLIGMMAFALLLYYVYILMKGDHQA